MDGKVLINEQDSNEDKKKFVFSLKDENEDNSIENSSTECKPALNTIKFNISLKYRINYTNLLKLLRGRDNSKYYTLNEFYCNLILMSSYLEPPEKLDYLSLMSYYYDERKSDENIYLINNKLEKYYNYFNYSNRHIFLYSFYRTSHFLSLQKKWFYSYKYIKKCADLIKRNDLDFSKDKKDLVNQQYDFIEKEFINYIKTKETLFNNKDFLAEEKCKKIRELIDLIFSDKYNIDVKDIKEENKDYIYAIKKEWIIKLKIFIEPFLNKPEETKNLIAKAFDPNYIYEYYFDEKNQTNKNISKLYPPYPGPINNFSLVSFKDCLKDNTNLDENDFIKKNLERNKDYIFVNFNDWNFLNQIFDNTNEIKRKNNNLDLIQIKYILLDKRINDKNKNINLLKQKYLQINKNSSIKALKDKILNCINNKLKKINKNKNIEQEVCFFILDKDKKMLLVEIILSFINGIQMYESLFIEKLELEEEKTLDNLFQKYDKKKHILIVEVTYKNDCNFLLQMDNNYKCNECGENIYNLDNRYICDICHFSLFCSYRCAYNSEEHKNIDKLLKNLMDSNFDLSELLSLHFGSVISRGAHCGRIGLYNLGNTCYLNSVLQCLSNTIDLTKYFLNQSFKKEIFKGKPSGELGLLSQTYYSFISSMWNNYDRNEDAISPRNLKTVFCEKTKLFNNLEQQDPHEFLVAFLDSLSKDLIRASNHNDDMKLEEKKEGETDEQESNKWWEYYKNKEDSIIVDLFQGQFKTTIKCSNCENYVVSYDNFKTLDLPIPQKKTQNQIRLFTNKLNYVEFNFKADGKTQIKDIIYNSINYLDKSNYLGNVKKIDIKGHLFNYNITEVPEKLLYDNIQLIEFNKDHKIINIFKPNYNNYINIYNNNEKNKKTKDIPFDNLKYLDFVNKKTSSELILFEKDINSNLENYIDIYVYPITEIEKETMFFDIAKVDKIISYPVIISKKKYDTLKSLHISIVRKLQYIIHNQGQINIDSVELFYPHFNHRWDNYKIKNGICPICQKPYDKNTKFCRLFNNFTQNNFLFNLINDKNKDIPLILYAKSFIYNQESQLYKGIDLFFEKKIKIESKKYITIYDSLELFTSEEILEGENMWFCNKCNEKTKAEKKIQIYRAPYYLIIQLKRFKSKKNKDGKTTLGSKNETFIEYKEFLNLKEFVIGPDRDKSIYDLYGIVLHKKFLNTHYISFCSNLGVWISYDDTEINAAENIINKDAYLLFYKRRSYG